MRKERKKTGEKRPFWESVGTKLEIDADMIRGGSLVEIRGRSRVEIGGVKKIGSYSTECVVLMMNQGSILVCGERLECIFYRRGEAAVEGKISSVCFSE
jgi:sporulation protein YqfC